MHYRKTQTTILVRLQRGEKLIESLNALAQQERLSAAWLHGLGGAQSAELGFYDLEAHRYDWHSFEELLEITSLQGNLSWVDSQPKWHIHGTFSGHDYRAVGGHVKELVVGGTCELKIEILEMELRRSRDEATGLDLLDIS